VVFQKAIQCPWHDHLAFSRTVDTYPSVLAYETAHTFETSPLEESWRPFLPEFKDNAT